MTRRSAAALALAGVLAVVYLPAMRELLGIWLHDTYSIHGLAVPFFSLFLIWSERPRLAALPARPEGMGLAPMVAGLALLAAGTAADAPWLQALSVPPVAIGLTLWAWGTARLRAIAFPLAFLGLMAPVPPAVVVAVSLYLQSFAAWCATVALGAVGIPAYRDGVLIELPAITLRVAEICNGLRFLMALLVLTIAAAHVTQRSWRGKLVLVGAAVPVAVLANAARVSIIAVAAHYWGREAAVGAVHHTIGKVVWAMALVPLLALAWFMRRGGPDGDPPGRVETERRKRAVEFAEGRP